MNYRVSIIPNRDAPEIVMWSADNSKPIRQVLTRNQVTLLIKQAHDAASQMDWGPDRDPQLGADS